VSNINLSLIGAFDGWKDFVIKENLVVESGCILTDEGSFKKY